MTAAVVREATATGRALEGVATTHLARCAAGDRVPVYLRASTFRLPPSHATPVIMIGPGTGVAPFRGFLQERAAAAAAGAALGPAHLFFGCRSAKADFIYEGELQAALRAGTLTRLHTAFSRDAKQKVYVQHRLAEAGAEVAALIEAGGWVYVCGDAKAMARDVHAALRALLGGDAGGDAALKALADGGRYHKDVW